MSLKKLIFSDLFLSDQAETSWYKVTPDSMETRQVPVECEAELSDLYRHLEEKKDGTDFRVDWPDAFGLRLRIKRMSIDEGKTIYVCRRYQVLPGTLSSLGMPARISEKLLSADIKDGLILFLGKAGAGKTTAAASFINERLHRYGGVCWTVENPIELSLQGKCGKGWCYQTEVASDDLIGPAVRDMMRATPNIIFIGELRDAQAVREAVTASTSGHLVVATFHAGDLLSGIARLVRLAGDDSSSAVADALRMAMHLSLQYPKQEGLPAGFNAAAKNGINAAPNKVLGVESLWLSGAATEAIRSMVRGGSVHLLVSEVDRQRRAILTNGVLS